MKIKDITTKEELVEYMMIPFTSSTVSYQGVSAAAMRELMLNFLADQNDMSRDETLDKSSPLP